MKVLNARQSLNKAHLKLKPIREEYDNFKNNLVNLINKINEKESEEFHKNLIIDFFKKTFYDRHKFFINTKGRYDLVIHNGEDSNSSVGVIVEVKSPSNRSEMISENNLNSKAFYELVYYFLQERVSNNNYEIKNLIVTNVYEWYIFDANIFEKIFYQNKELVEKFKDFESKRLSGTKTDFFYNEILNPFVRENCNDIEFTYFDIKQEYNAYLSNKSNSELRIITLFKLFSPQHLLKLPFLNDSNTLDEKFYNELLYIIGLKEVETGNKIIIKRRDPDERNSGSILENTIIQLESLGKLDQIDNVNQYGDTKEERLFNIALELSITWINRILFSKLLEAQLLRYHKGDKSYSFLNTNVIKNYTDLNKLFFQVLAVKQEERLPEIKKLFEKVPYLNSSLFEPTKLETQTIFISNLENNKIPLYSQTVLKDHTGKKKTGNINTLEYLFEFLDAYDFSSEGGEEIQESNKTLINASVLGLIFEKINGYKDGSFFTPSFITMFMCREAIRTAVIQKFNEIKGWNCKTIEDLYNKIEDIKEANEIINCIKICDPAVGSGHFLVSALNEIIAIKNDLKILMDTKGKRLKEYNIEVVNDELIILDEDGKLFEYIPGNSESQRVQEALFHEKKTIIENCLFGVDINQNSVNICRLRLWIELLKNAYYKNNNELETLPNIDINIKCGNSLINQYPIDADLRPILKSSKWTINDYKIAITAYHNAKSKDEKKKIEKLISHIKSEVKRGIFTNKEERKMRKLKDQLYKEVNKPLIEIKKSEEEQSIWNKRIQELTKEIQKLESKNGNHNKIYSNAFEWRFEFPEVLNSEGDFIGFDVVIGNPPYKFLSGKGSPIQELLAKGNEYGANTLKEMYEVISNNFPESSKECKDLYKWFIDLGRKILKDNGIIAYITPNTFITLSKYEDIRIIIFEKLSNLLLVDLGFGVFQKPTVPSAIFISQKSNISKNIDYKVKYIDLKDLLKNSENTQNINLNYLFDKKNIIEVEYYNHKLHLYKHSLAQKIYSIFYTKLEDYIKISEGEHSLNNDFSKIYTKKNSNVIPVIYDLSLQKYVPAKIVYLNKSMCKKYDQNLHSGKRLFLRKTGDRILVVPPEKYEFAIAHQNLYVLKLKNKIVDIEFFIALLNSKLLNFLYQNGIYGQKGRTLAQFRIYALNLLPIPELKGNKNKKVVTEILSVTKKILSLTKDDDYATNPKKQKKVAEYENEIDNLIYQLYDLNDDEIKMVEDYFK